MTEHTSQTISKGRTTQLQTFLEKINIHNARHLFKEEKGHPRLLKIDEALTHTSAHLPRNHERLEFLGDAVLRLAASEFIDRNYSAMSVGERSELRAQLVSDRWLALVGQQIGIKEILITGPKASGDQSACKTLEAEATEALIGALYECFNDLHAIHNWLKPYWEEASIAFLADPHKQNPKSALQEWIQARGRDLPKYEIQEQSKQHGDPKRFFYKVLLKNQFIGEGYGGSRQEAEKAAAYMAMISTLV